MAKKLDTGDPFPSMTLALVGGTALTVPDEINASYAILLFYRGHW